MHHKRQGVDIKWPPEQNVHSWLDLASPNFNPQLHQAIFYYRARLTKEDRFKVCIALPEMDAAAWRFAHHNQLILDGTFGVCSSRLLLFIAMGLDDTGKGLPLAFFLFSAPTGNRATHAGYNRAILQELLEEWKMHLSRRNSSRPFVPYVAITDTDTKERGALQDVWPKIWLLLCKFHVRQCWTNRRKTLKLVSNQDSDNFWKHHVYARLRNLEAQYVS
jgi:MULE transposase domain